MEIRKRILVVDNQAEMRSLLTAFLLSQGYLVDIARLAEAALQVVRSTTKPVAAIVSDIGMAPMDGMTLLLVSKAERPEIPVILMTGEPDAQQRKKALARGASEYLAKPFSLERLREVLLEVLREKHDPVSASA